MPRTIFGIIASGRCWRGLILFVLLPIAPLPGKEITIPIGDVFELKPSVGITIRSQANIFSDANRAKPKDDLVIVVSPGVSLVYPHKYLTLELDYLFDIEQFVQLTEEDTVNQEISTTLTYQHPSERWSLQLGQSFLDTRDTRSADFANSRLASRADRKAYTTTVALETDVSPLVTATYDASRSIDRFEDKFLPGGDTIATEFGVGLDYKLWTVTSAQLEYRIERTRFPNDNLVPRSDTTVHTILTGFARDITAKIAGKLALGLTRDIPDDRQIGGQPQTIVATEVDLTWSILKRSSLGLTLGRGFERGSALSTSSAVRTGVGLALTHGFGERLTGKISTEIARNEFRRSARRDRNTIWDIGLTYAFTRWLSLGLHYKRDANQSNEAGRDFVDEGYGSTITISLTF